MQVKLKLSFLILKGEIVDIFKFGDNDSEKNQTRCLKT